MTISDQTADKLLKGEFKTFEELENTNIDPYNNSSIEVLYRRSNKRGKMIYIIETIFINE
jgi:hypothetical protein